LAVTGDVLTPQLMVAPYADDTAAALRITSPDAAVDVAVYSSDGGHNWVGQQITFTTEGEWYLDWTVTGTGRGTARQTVVVDVPAGYTPDGFSYATTGDLARYTGKPLQADARRKLINASREIDRITRAAVYATDTHGYAVDTVVRKALADATCELVAWWAETGTETGAAALITNASIAGVSIGYGGKTSGNPQADRVGPRIWSILLNANLVRAGVSYG
jgi:hypothetical protein